MAHYALLDNNNIVIAVIVGIDENELIEGKEPEKWYGDFHQKKCVRTSYNNKIRKQYAGVGFFYDENKDIFIAPQPFPSWKLDTNNDWQPPKPRPDGLDWNWLEDLGEWINVEGNA